MKNKVISDETRRAILDATHALLVEQGKVNVSQSAIAEAAGVSRQTIFIAFGSRADLLVALVQDIDAKFGYADQLSAISHQKTISPDEFIEYITIWLDYLPIIYPIGSLLDAVSPKDADAALAWDNRMKGALLAGLVRICKSLKAGRHLEKGWTPQRAAELVWSLVHPANWRLLVVSCQWPEQMFRESRISLVRDTVLARARLG